MIGGVPYGTLDQTTTPKEEVNMSATAAEVQFVRPQVVTRVYEEIEVGGVTVIVPQSQIIVGGEYKDEPDLVIQVLHAVNPDGQDVSEAVARRIATLLAGA